MRLNSSRMILAGCALLLAAGPVRAAGVAGPVAGPKTPVFESKDFARAARAARVGSGLRLENVQVSDTGEPAALVLERFEVFTPDATVTLHGDGGARVVPAPKNTYFRGVIDGRPDSRAFLALFEDGTSQGVVSDGEAMYMIGGEGTPLKALGTAPLEMRRIEPALLKTARNAGFQCGNEKLPANPLHGGGSLPPGLDFTAASPAPVGKAATAAIVAAYTAQVAIETDFEFYQLFNNSTTATNYIGNLIGYASTIYVKEINTSLAVQSVSLWTTSNDPWTQTSTLCGLLEFGKYWNQNKTGVTRTTAHFMSGKNLGGGIAWLGVLCDGSFSTGAAASCPGLGSETTPWGGAYGFTSSLNGTFNVNNPTAMWDIIAVSHEIGHNFNSPHTHCYAGIGGNASPIDQCWSGESGCYSGATSLPGPAGQGSGTIMSYCHQLAGGYGNISLDFGTNHPYGVQPGREAARMSAYVTSTAAGNPSCLAPVSVSSGIFSDGFEAGNLVSWQ